PLLHYQFEVQRRQEREYRGQFRSRRSRFDTGDRRLSQPGVATFMLLECTAMQSAPPAAVSSSLDAVGNTPLLRLAALTDATGADVYVKLESFNPTASYKDRMARAIIEKAEERGQLRPGMRVVEYSGGSTGSSLAFVCAVKGYPLTIVSSDAFAEEKLKTIRAFGADVVIIPSEGGAITGDLIAAMRARAAELAARD